MACVGAGRCEMSNLNEQKAMRLLVNNFMDKIDLKPLIIFEWINAKKIEIIDLLDKMKKKKLSFFKNWERPDLLSKKSNI